MLKRGKEKKVALTACMRKFLTILNAMLRDRQPFRASFVLFSNLRNNNCLDIQDSCCTRC
jgi:hypothetical protein